MTARIRCPPLRARIVHRAATSHALAYSFGAPRADDNEETVAIAASLGFTAGFTTRNDFARQTEPALERSRFVVLAAVTAAELAHRIAYAWPR